MFIDDLTKLQNNIENSKDIIMSEEHTKMAFIVPFIQILGYDVFNPLEVIPEYTCDFGTKKGEKVDYCIMNGKQPYILVECKDCRNKLTQDNISQLFRYYSVSSARIAILTNGIDYMLFTDSVETNKMDSDPFYRFNILSISSEDIHIIKMLAKENINDNSISSYSKIALFRSEVDNWINSEKNALSRDFINFIKKKINTYNLPNEEISRIVISKLFQEGTSLDCSKNSLTVENESHKSKKEDKFVYFETDNERGYVSNSRSFSDEESAMQYAYDVLKIINGSLNSSSLKDMAVRYIVNNYKYSEKRAEKMVMQMASHIDIFEEFSNYMRIGKFRKKDRSQTQIEGYTAERLCNEFNLSPLWAYNYLVYLREDSKNALADLKAGLPRK